MKTLVTIVGNRPQFIKLTRVFSALEKVKGFRNVLIHTGQHYDDALSDVFFRELDLPRPDVNLGLGSGSHGEQTGRMLEKIERLLRKIRPTGVIVYGDTNSTLAGALAAVKLHIPVAHIEAGLRSFNRRMPEEINRIVTDCVSEFLFAPTDAAVRNLRKEGVAGKKIFRVGDVMYDAAKHFAKKAAQESRILNTLGLEKGRYVLSTVHRAENTDEPARLRAVLEGFARVSNRMPVVLPLHPRTKKALERMKSLRKFNRSIRMIDPVGYLDMVLLEKNAALIATDSGGVQKEAFFYRVPCVTLRTETEWVELVEAGWNTVVPPESHEAVEKHVLGRIGGRGKDVFPYGRGNAAAKIAKILTERLR